MSRCSRFRVRRTEDSDSLGLRRRCDRSFVEDRNGSTKQHVYSIVCFGILNNLAVSLFPHPHPLIANAYCFFASLSCFFNALPRISLCRPANQHIRLAPISSIPEVVTYASCTKSQWIPEGTRPRNPSTHASRTASIHTPAPEHRGSTRSNRASNAHRHPASGPTRMIS